MLSPLIQRGDQVCQILGDVTMKNIIVPVVSLLLATTAVVGHEKKNAPESSKLKVVQEFG